MSLAIVESELFDPGKSVLNWDGTAYKYDSWERDHNLSSALQHSVTWYYEKAFALGQPLLLDNFLDSISYGKTDKILVTVQNYLENLYQTPLNQTLFMKKLYYGELDCTAAGQDEVKRMLYRGQFGQYSLSGKTGTAVNSKNITSGWFTGFAEKNNRVYIFSVYHPGQSGLEVMTYIKNLLENDIDLISF